MRGFIVHHWTPHLSGTLCSLVPQLFLCFKVIALWGSWPETPPHPEMICRPEGTRRDNERRWKSRLFFHLKWSEKPLRDGRGGEQSEALSGEQKWTGGGIVLRPLRAVMAGKLQREAQSHGWRLYCVSGLIIFPRRGRSVNFPLSLLCSLHATVLFACIPISLFFPPHTLLALCTSVFGCLLSFASSFVSPKNLHLCLPFFSGLAHPPMRMIIPSGSRLSWGAHLPLPTNHHGCSSSYSLVVG